MDKTGKKEQSRLLMKTWYVLKDLYHINKKMMTKCHRSQNTFTTYENQNTKKLQNTSLLQNTYLSQNTSQHKSSEGLVTEPRLTNSRERLEVS